MERISTFLFHQRATQGMLDNQARLSRTQMELATGRRILTPSDDPSGAVKSLDLRRYLASNEQFVGNMSVVRARLEQQESTLERVTDLLQRARELAIQGNNGTAGQVARDGIAEEVDQLLEQMLALANAQDSNGEHLFGGLDRTSPAFSRSGGVVTYDGSDVQRQLQVSEDRRMADGETGRAVFMSVNASGDSAFAIVGALAQGLRAGTDLLNALDDLANINADMAVTLESQLSEIQDLDYAEAVARMNRQLVALQASQQSYAKLTQLSLFNYL